MTTDGDKPFCSTTEDGVGLFNQLHADFAEAWQEENVVERIEDTGLEYIGQGDSRIVLLDETGEYLSQPYSCVVKVNKYGDNEANRTEVRNWESVEGQPKKHLMRVTDYDDEYRWVVMPYVDTNVTEEMLMEMEKAFIKNGLKIRDVNKRNAARVEDRAVMIDYDMHIEQIDMDVMDEDERLRLIEWKYE